MDFFEQQDAARRNTRLLAGLFLLAVILLILLANAAVAAFLYIGQDYNIYSGSDQGLQGFLSFFTWSRFGNLSLGITAAIGLVVLINWIRLSSGGKAVAEGMGGTRIVPQTRDAKERRCLNIVEEMALAANMPVPPVYVLNNERGINAFAAGVTPADAIVAVTRGTLVQLKRHELQGVIAHEFSHILNGDMRLNIRLAAMLKGITFVGDIGHFLMRSGSMRRGHQSGNANMALPVLGIMLWAVGWLGGLCAGFIKAAISRQKEFLADASAVQFTRSADGIGDALKVIGGYLPGTLVHAARAMEMSHIFFGQIEHRLWQVFATHPPLEKRIARVEPDWDGRFIERETVHYEAEPSRPGFGEVGVGRAAIVAAAIGGALADDIAFDRQSADQNQDHLDHDVDEAPSQKEIPAALVQYSREPLGAQAIALCLFMSEEETAKQLEFSQISQADIIGLETLVATLLPAVADLGSPLRLPLLELCMPALKAMSTKQYRRFKKLVSAVVQADKRIDLHEWCLYQLLRHYLDPEFLRVTPSRSQHRRLSQVKQPLQAVLSVIAYEDDSDPTSAFRCGVDSLELSGLSLLSRNEASVAAFSKGVHELANCFPLIKPRVLKAMIATAQHDGTLTPEEREIIASMAAVMDCPQPTLL